MEIKAKLSTANEIDCDSITAFDSDTEDVFLLTLRAFCNESPKQVALARSHIEDADWQAYKRVVHGLKPSLRMIGAASLGQMAFMLECAARDGDTRLCLEMTESFLERVSLLTSQIKSIIDEKPLDEQSERRVVDISEMEGMLFALAGACGASNASLADDCARELATSSFGDDRDLLLSLIVESVEMLEYKEAMRKIRALISAL